VCRFYFESDGDGPKYSRSNEYYVVDSYGNPSKNQDRIDIKHFGEFGSKSGRQMAKEARNLAADYNKNPPWPIWDMKAAKRHGHECPVCEGEGTVNDADFSDGDSDRQMFLAQDTTRTCGNCKGEL